MVRGFAILLLMQLLGEGISRYFTLPVPGNVLGMVLLFIALQVKLVKSGWIEDAVELLLSHMALLFVPAGVGVMVYFDLIVTEWLPISVALVVSTFVVLAVTAWVADRTMSGSGRHE